MSVLLSVTSIIVASLVILPIQKHYTQNGIILPYIFYFLTFALPFSAGGFHTYSALLASIIMLVNLVFLYLKSNQLSFFRNFNFITILLVLIAYTLTPLWAADKGMAAFGILRFMPHFLFALTLMQYPKSIYKNLLVSIPLCGVIMTLCSLLLMPHPAMTPFMTVNGRLAGFFQYPNTFSTFLLAGFILINQKDRFEKYDPLLNFILTLGIVLSGSRTGFILFIITVIYLMWSTKDRKKNLYLIIIITCSLVFGLIFSHISTLTNADRFTNIKINSGTFLARLLYYKDALPVILENPFGTGYLGYKALQGSIQTGTYSVSFVHNGLLQIFLDIGWLPALFLSIVFLRAIFSKKTISTNRTLLVILLAHCMLDFNLQFISIWVILLGTLDFHTGKQYIYKRSKPPVLVSFALALIICLWLGAGDLCNSFGLTKTSLLITPFHTQALETELIRTENVDELNRLADTILSLNRTNTLAYDAKANVSLSNGNVLEMIRHKETAIMCSRYSVSEYCDYFDKLYAVYNIYLKSGDINSASYCREKLLSITDMMKTVENSTSPLAHLTGDDPSLQLPEKYITMLNQLKHH